MRQPSNRIPPGLRPRAFSLIEVLVTVTVIGILALLAMEATTSLRLGAKSTKLDSDVAAVNQSIKVYLANGGTLEGATDASQVLRKLKTRREQADAEAYAGFRADMIDHRVIAVSQTEEEAASAAPRALWNAAEKRFEVVRGGAAGIGRFDLDDAAGRVDAGTEARAAGPVDLNRGDGWIWNYEDATPLGNLEPAVVPLSMPAPLAPKAPAPPGVLQAPVLSHPGGLYRYNTFPDTVTLSNPNGTGDIMFALQWSAGGVDWQLYTEAIAMAEGAQLLAYVRPSSGEHTQSQVVGGSYQLEYTDLNPAEIHASAALLNLASNEAVSIELVNSNPSEYQSRLEYAISGEEFHAYSGPISILPSDHAGGIEIVARVAPGIAGFHPSRSTTLTLPVKLRPPLIEPAQDEATFLITLTNANPEGVSTLRYAIKDLRTSAVGDMNEYSKAFLVNGANYGKGFEIIAYAVATRPGYLDSDPTNTVGRSFFGTEVADRAILVLDISGSMAWMGRMASVKAEAKRLMATMPRDGKMGIISFSNKARTEFAYQATTSGKITEAQGIIDSLKPSGSTNYSAALSLALDIIKANPDVEQVVFLSDGAPTAGDTSTSGILNWVDKIAARNVALSPIGYHMTTNAERNLIKKMKEHGVPQISTP